MTDSEIKQYLRTPATAQERLNALAVHSVGSQVEERAADSVAAVREQYGYLHVPVGSGHPLVTNRV